MMKKLFLGLLLAMTMLVQAQTIQVEGVQSGVWDADTVLVTGDVEVMDGLSIMPGVTVLFDGYYGITVKKGASFTAQGMAGDSIVFTVADTTGFHLYNMGVGAWNGFLLEHAGPVLFDYCVLQYAKAADTLDMQGGALMIINSDDVEIAHSTLRCNLAREHGGAIYAVDSEIRMSESALNNNKVDGDEIIYAMYGGAAGFLKCDVTLTDMEFIGNVGERCIGGALSLDSCALMLDRAVFADNIGINGGGMYLMRCNHKVCRLSNLLFCNNFTRHFAGAIAFCDASPEVYNMTVTRNASEGVNCNGIFFYQYSSPKLTNCIVYGNYPLYDSGVGGDTVQMWAWTFEGEAPEFRNCLVEDPNHSITNFEYITVYEDVMDADPMFVDPENGDFRLSAESPCRDAGMVQTPQDILEGLDLDGNPRVFNGRIDMGPYECSLVPVTESVGHQDVARLLGNPIDAKSRLVVEVEKTGPVEVRVSDLTGHLLVEKSFGPSAIGTMELRLGDMMAGLGEGLYLIEVLTNGNTFSFKAIK